jgi:hypothetical protein
LLHPRHSTLPAGRHAAPVPELLHFGGAVRQMTDSASAPLFHGPDVAGNVLDLHAAGCRRAMGHPDAGHGWRTQRSLSRRPPTGSPSSFRRRSTLSRQVERAARPSRTKPQQAAPEVGSSWLILISARRPQTCRAVAWDVRRGRMARWLPWRMRIAPGCANHLDAKILGSGYGAWLLGARGGVSSGPIPCSGVRAGGLSSVISWSGDVCDRLGGVRNT